MNFSLRHINTQDARSYFIFKSLEPKLLKHPKGIKAFSSGFTGIKILKKHDKVLATKKYI